MNASICHIVCIFLFTVCAFAQTRNTNPSVQPAQPKPRKAVITTTDGSVVRGELLKLELDSLVIKGAIGTNTIKLDNVKRIDFGDEVQAPPQTAASPEQVAIQGSIKAIQTLAVTAEAGLSYSEYRMRLADLTAQVQDSLKNIASKEIKQHIEKAMAAMTLAKEVWDLSFSLRGNSQRERESRQDLIDTVKSYWGKAKDSLAEAERLQKNQKQ